MVFISNHLPTSTTPHALLPHSPDTILNLFSVTHMYMCLRLKTWHWITYQGVHPWRRQISPSLCNPWLPLALLRGEP